MGRDTRERERETCWIRECGILRCDRINSVRSTTRVAHQPLCFPSGSIRDGYSAATRYLRDPSSSQLMVLFSVSVHRERERGKRVVRCWGDRCERSPEEKVCDRVVDGTCLLKRVIPSLFVCVRVCACTPKDSRMLEADWPRCFSQCKWFLRATNRIYSRIFSRIDQDKCVFEEYVRFNWSWLDACRRR